MIVVRLSGGMGNQMFQYALGRALSLRYNVPLSLDTTFLDHRIQMPKFLRPHFVFRKYDLDVFNVHAKIAERNDIPSFWHRPISSGKLMLVIDALFRKFPLLRGWEKSFSYDEKILSLGPDTYLSGFWQSPKYFKGYEETIRNDFTLRKPLAEISKKIFDEIQNCQSVCVHVRRSDIAEKSFHGSADVSYYQKAIEYIAKQKNIEKIFIFSDDDKWCRDNLTFDYPTVVVEALHAGTKGEGHLALMSACKHFIIPNSTFSWWAAWLNTNSDKIVIAPKRWFSKGKIDIIDLIPEEWILL